MIYFRNEEGVLIPITSTTVNSDVANYLKTHKRLQLIKEDGDRYSEAWFEGTIDDLNNMDEKLVNYWEDTAVDAYDSTVTTIQKYQNNDQSWIMTLQGIPQYNSTYCTVSNSWTRAIKLSARDDLWLVTFDIQFNPTSSWAINQNFIKLPNTPIHTGGWIWHIWTNADGNNATGGWIRVNAGNAWCSGAGTGWRANHECCARVEYFGHGTPSYN